LEAGGARPRYLTRLIRRALGHAGAALSGRDHRQRQQGKQRKNDANAFHTGLLTKVVGLHWP
jgi:hypothetical protein